jgi:hypothetical protein
VQGISCNEVCTGRDKSPDIRQETEIGRGGARSKHLPDWYENILLEDVSEHDCEFWGIDDSTKCSVDVVTVLNKNKI